MFIDHDNNILAIICYIGSRCSMQTVVIVKTIEPAATSLLFAVYVFILLSDTTKVRIIGMRNARMSSRHWALIIMSSVVDT